MRSHLIIFTLTLTITTCLVTTGFAQDPHGPNEASKEQIMSFHEGDTIYVDQDRCVSCDTPVGEGTARTQSLTESVDSPDQTVTEFVFSGSELVLDVSEI